MGRVAVAVQRMQTLVHGLLIRGSQETFQTKVPRQNPREGRPKKGWWRQWSTETSGECETHTNNTQPTNTAMTTYHEHEAEICRAGGETGVVQVTQQLCCDSLQHIS